MTDNEAKLMMGLAAAFKMRGAMLVKHIVTDGDSRTESWSVEGPDIAMRLDDVQDAIRAYIRLSLPSTLALDQAESELVARRK